MYKLRYPAFSGGESGFVGASGAATDIPFIVGDSLAHRQGGVGTYILMRHWEGGMSSSQEKQVNAKKQKKDGRLEGRTTSVGSSTRLDGSQGKLKAEKSGRSKHQVSTSNSIQPGDGLDEMKARLQVMKFGGTSVGD